MHLIARSNHHNNYTITDPRNHFSLTHNFKMHGKKATQRLAIHMGLLCNAMAFHLQTQLNTLQNTANTNS